MLGGELAQGLDDMLLDDGCLRVRVVGVVGHDRGRKVRAVDRIMDGDGDLKLGITVDDGAGYACPHRLAVAQSAGDMDMLS